MIKCLIVKRCQRMNVVQRYQAGLHIVSPIGVIGLVLVFINMTSIN